MPNRPSGNPSEVGFSLGELLAVIVVVAVVAAIVLPSASRATAPHRLDEQLYALGVALADARARAVAESRPYRLSVEGSDRYLIEARGEAGWATVRGPVRLPGGVRIHLAAAGDPILFHPSGHAAAPATVRLVAGARTRTLRVLGSGLVRVERETR